MTGGRGDARPVEPGVSRSTTISWERLDDILNRVLEAKSLVEAINLAAGNNALTHKATDAIQTVCAVVDYRLSDAWELVEEVMDTCK